MDVSRLMFRDGLMDGQRILITGGGTGLGREMAEAFSQARRDRAYLRPTSEQARGMRRRADGGSWRPLMRMLLDAKLLHGDCLTVTGKTVAQNLKSVKPYPADQQIIKPLSAPIKKDSHLVVMYGNLAPDGAVAKRGKCADGEARPCCTPAFGAQSYLRCAFGEHRQQ